MRHADPVDDRALLALYRSWPTANLKLTWESFYSAREYNDRRMRAIEQVLRDRGEPIKTDVPPTRIR